MAPVRELHFQPRRENKKNSSYPCFALTHHTNQISNQSLERVVHISPNMSFNRKIHNQVIVSRLLGAWQLHRVAVNN